MTDFCCCFVACNSVECKNETPPLKFENFEKKKGIVLGVIIAAGE